jgi:hypothetical protein
MDGVTMMVARYNLDNTEKFQQDIKMLNANLGYELIDESIWYRIFMDKLSNGDNDGAELVLSHFPSLVNFKNKNNESPISLAYSRGNMEGVKLCMAFKEIYQYDQNECSITKLLPHNIMPYQARYIPVSLYNFDKNNNVGDDLFIIIAGPESYDANIGQNFINSLKNNGVKLLVIGDGKYTTPIDRMKQIMRDEIVGSIDDITNVNIAIIAHGYSSNGKFSMEDDAQHIIQTGLKTWEESKNLFEFLGDFFQKKNLGILFVPCFGGLALKDHGYLPKNTKMLTISKYDQAGAIDDADNIIFSSDKDEFFKELKDFPNSMLDKYLVNMKSMNATPGTLADAGHYFFDEPKFTKRVGTEITDCEKEYIFSKLNILGINDDISSRVVKKIQNSSSIEQLKAPSTIDLKSILKKIHSKEKGTEQRCEVDSGINQITENKLFNAELDYGICQEYSKGDGCDPMPEEPTFGLALYLLKELESPELKAKCGVNQVSDDNLSLE